MNNTERKKSTYKMIDDTAREKAIGKAIDDEDDRLRTAPEAITKKSEAGSEVSTTPFSFTVFVP
jgi:hypothetical protein